jgi:NitT/TauT family transport system permease protein
MVARLNCPTCTFGAVSLGLLVAAWYVGSQLAGARLLPGPHVVALTILNEARSGALAFNLGTTPARVTVAFVIAMTLGSILGLLMGRFRVADLLGDSWLVVLLNLPALIIIVLAYVWAGLTETAAIAAAALNKLPIATVTIREGARSLDPQLDDMAQVFRMELWARIPHVILPQLAALPCGRGPLWAVAGVENRAHRRTPRAAQRRWI